MIRCCDVVMFHCRIWAISRWRCWRQCWWGRSWYCTQVTMTVMTIAFHTSLASQWVLSDGHSLCCRQCVTVGGTPSVAGRSHRLVTGSDINSGDWLQVSVQCKPSCFMSKMTYKHSKLGQTDLVFGLWTEFISRPVCVCVWLQVSAFSQCELCDHG